MPSSFVEFFCCCFGEPKDTSGCLESSCQFDLRIVTWLHGVDNAHVSDDDTNTTTHHQIPTAVSQAYELQILPPVSQPNMSVPNPASQVLQNELPLTEPQQQVFTNPAADAAFSLSSNESVTTALSTEMGSFFNPESLRAGIQVGSVRFYREANTQHNLATNNEFTFHQRPGRRPAIIHIPSQVRHRSEHGEIFDSPRSYVSEQASRRDSLASITALYGEDPFDDDSLEQHERQFPSSVSWITSRQRSPDTLIVSPEVSPIEIEIIFLNEMIRRGEFGFLDIDLDSP